MQLFQWAILLHSLSAQGQQNQCNNAASAWLLCAPNNDWSFKGFNMSFSQMFGSLGSEVIAVCEISPGDTTSFGFIIVTFIFVLFVFLVCIACKVSIFGPEQKSGAITWNNNLINANEEPKIDNTFLNVFSIQKVCCVESIRVYCMSWVVLGRVYLKFIMSNSSNAMALMPCLSGTLMWSTNSQTYSSNMRFTLSTVSFGWAAF